MQIDTLAHHRRNGLVAIKTPFPPSLPSLPYDVNGPHVLSHLHVFLPQNIVAKKDHLQIKVCHQRETVQACFISTSLPSPQVLHCCVAGSNLHTQQSHYLLTLSDLSSDYDLMLGQVKSVEPPPSQATTTDFGNLLTVAEGKDTWQNDKYCSA